MITKLALQTQRDLLQQSNVEVPNDAFLALQHTVNQNIPGGGAQTVLQWNTISLANRITTTGSPVTNFIVPDTGWYTVSVSLLYSTVPSIIVRLAGSYNYTDTIMPTSEQDTVATNIFYLSAGASNLVYVQNNGAVTTCLSIYNRPLLLVKKIR